MIFNFFLCQRNDSKPTLSQLLFGLVTQHALFNEEERASWGKSGQQLHHLFYLPYLHDTKKFIYSGYSEKARKPPGLWESHLTLINKVKKKCCECVARPIQ